MAKLFDLVLRYHKSTAVSDTAADQLPPYSPADASGHAAGRTQSRSCCELRTDCDDLSPIALVYKAQHSQCGRTQTLPLHLR